MLLYVSTFFRIRQQEHAQRTTDHPARRQLLQHHGTKNRVGELPNERQQTPLDTLLVLWIAR